MDFTTLKLIFFKMYFINSLIVYQVSVLPGIKYDIQSFLC